MHMRKVMVGGDRMAMDAREVAFARLAPRVGMLEARKVAAAVAPLAALHRRFFPRADIGLLERAYAVAERYHRGQKRKSGEPFLIHPYSVTEVLAEIGMDTTTLVAALLHDTVEDTDLTLGDVNALFGEDVARLVDGVTKLDGAAWGDRAEAETMRKMILIAADDLRVLVIKLADRVHNLATLRHHPKPEKRERIARQSMELLVPFAERLGIYDLKRRLEDLAFATLDPDAYERTRAAMESGAGERAARLAPLMARLTDALGAARLEARVVTRDRHLYAIYRDRLRGADAPVRLGDATRITVLVNGSEADCYVALGVVHGVWRPLPGRVQDFIAMPKYNLYRGLHTAVVTPQRDVLELVIGTPQMHRLAEYGVVAQVQDAARASGQQAREAARRTDLEWLRNLLTWQSQAQHSQEFLHSLRQDLRPGAGIVAFTPAGEAVPLPTGATPVDFAFAVDVDLGCRAVGAVANGRPVGLSAPLEDGRVVEIIADSDPEAVPSQAWLESVRTGHARAAIQAALARARTEQAARDGRARVAAVLGARDVELLELERDGTALSVARALGFYDLEDLYEATEVGGVDQGALLERLLPGADAAERSAERSAVIARRYAQPSPEQDSTGR
jgi:GTP pyrophosphokinase